jgi:hypothetical protein
MALILRVLLEVREELEQEGYTTKMEGSKRDIKMRLQKEVSRRDSK